MSTLYVIRHGQARYNTDEPELSDLGHKQAAHLGTYWAKRKLHLDAIYHGPRKRQIDTAHGLIAAAREHGHALPRPVQLDDFDEYHASAIIKASVPRLEQEPEYHGLFNAKEPAKDAREQQRRFVKFFERAISFWLRGELEGEKVESFPTFYARVKRGIEQVMEAEGRGRRVAIVTSAGPVSVSVAKALGVDDVLTVKLSSVVWNTSITEHKYRGHELTLVGFNAVPHLPPEEVT